MSTYTCITCRADFASQEEREKHFRSDWHCYNVKRKIASLAPLSLALFEERQKRLESAKEEDKKEEKIYCNICKKSFSSKNQFAQHERSKRHLRGLKEAQEQFQRDGEKEELTEAHIEEPQENDEDNTTEEKTASGFAPEDYEFEPGRCIFCGFRSEDIDSNLVHMKQAHGFTFPDQDSIIDNYELLDYLAQKISLGCICIGCNHGFKTPHAVRAHMLDKGHTRMAYDTQEDFDEFSEFYDYTEANEKPNSNISLLSTGELQLEDGRIIGNREFARYYKQVYANENEKREVIKNKMFLENGSVPAQSAALMVYQEQKKAVVTKREDVERLHRYAIRERLREGMNMNKIHLAHFCHR